MGVHQIYYMFSKKKKNKKTFEITIKVFKHWIAWVFLILIRISCSFLLCHFAYIRHIDI